ncbi:MAG: OmpA family protein [Gemmatimonadetes bacterium]|nr:OmpA family protein [Gemmatimonadota bacterium]
MDPNTFRIAMSFTVAVAFIACGGKSPAAAPSPMPVEERVANAEPPRVEPDADADRLRREREDEMRRRSNADRATLAEMIHFDFDRADIRPEDRPLLDAKLAILRADPTVVLHITGHADERGSDEYNLALGMRRALAASGYLRTRGIDAARLTATSRGEEQPLDLRQTEAAWAANRRAEFAIPASSTGSPE